MGKHSGINTKLPANKDNRLIATLFVFMLTSGVLLLIHPGHGKTMVRIDGKTYIFLNEKCAATHLMERNPCEAQWTDLYRRKHKNGIEKDSTKKRVCGNEL